MIYNNEEMLVKDLISRRNKTYGSDNLKRALVELENPQQDLKSVVIGGTNGKGSTTNFLYSLLRQQDLKVASFTSPHMETHRDRIKINNQYISSADFIDYANKTLFLWEKYDLSMFEIDFIIACLYFQDHKVDYALFEVGLGGRLDASSILHPEVMGITNVSFDHMNILGDRLEKIAWEKAGIFKENIPIFTTESQKEVLAVFQEEANKKGAKLIRLKVPNYEKKDRELLVKSSPSYQLKDQAQYQVANSYLALNLARYLLGDIFNPSLAFHSIVWPGRFEKIAPNLILDGAHNEAGLLALIDEIPHLKKPVDVLFASMADKDYERSIELLEKEVRSLVLTEFDFFRVLKIDEFDYPNKEKNYKKALEELLKNNREGTIVVTGSLYFIAEVRQYLHKKRKAD